MATDARPTPHPVANAPGPEHDRAERDRELAALLIGAANGDSADFERFYDRSIGHARALARRIVAASDVDDALADAYLHAWRHADHFDAARGSALTWLLTIVHSRAVDLLRRRHDGQFVDADLDTCADPADLADALWQVESGQRLHTALAGLSGRERWVLGLAYFRDQSHSAIAASTGMPLGTVKSLILRAHAKLRTELSTLT